MQLEDKAADKMAAGEMNMWAKHKSVNGLMCKSLAMIRWINYYV